MAAKLQMQLTIAFGADYAEQSLSNIYLQLF
jgi:hypothetical protein